MTRYFDDHVIGDKMRHGAYPVTREDVLAFASKFAWPVEGAEKLENIRTSGCHSLSIYQRLQIEMAFANESAMAMLAAAGLDEVRWLTPVHSGDVLELEMEVLEKIESRSKPDRGILKVRYTLYNQNGDVALTLISSNFVKRRPNEESAHPN